MATTRTNVLPKADLRLGRGARGARGGRGKRGERGRV